MALISVIIPVYKVEKYIKQCVDSVLSQNFKDIEVVLVDDGSPDNCPNICDEYAKKDIRVKVIHKKNGGLSDARNYGVKVAAGEFIIFLDSDDYWVNGSLEKIYQCAMESKNLDMMFLSAAKYFEEKDKLEDKFETLDRKMVKDKTHEEVLEYLAASEKFPVSACTKLIRRNLIVDNNLYFEKGLLSEDIDWSTRLLLAAKKFDVCEADFYVYRKQRSGSITNGVGIKNVKDMLYIVKKWTSYCKSNNLNESLTDSILGLYAYEYLILMSHIFSIKKEERKLIYSDITNLKWVLKHSKSKKTKLVKLVANIVGVRISAYMLNKYVMMNDK